MKKLISLLSLAFLLIHCTKEDRQVESNTIAYDSLSAKADVKVEEEKPNVTYEPLFFPEKSRDSVMAVFNEKYTKEEQYVILALNRLDLQNKWRADTLMIPSIIDSTLMEYSPFPKKIEALQKVDKLVTFSYPIQAYAVYTQGELVKWGPTSMGKKAAITKTGLMFANWKKELAISTVNKSWKLPYNFNIHNTLGIGWHQYDLPGYPASHSCLRLLMDDAKWLYQYADSWILTKGGASVRANGTPVIIFGEYGWGKAKPWKKLSENALINDISEDELTKIIEPYLDKILTEQDNRKKVLAEIEQEKLNKEPQS